MRRARASDLAAASDCTSATLGGSQKRCLEAVASGWPNQASKPQCGVRMVSVNGRESGQTLYIRSAKREEAESLKETSLSASLASYSEDECESRRLREDGGPGGTQPEVEG